MTVVQQIRSIKTVYGVVMQGLKLLSGVGKQYSASSYRRLSGVAMLNGQTAGGRTGEDGLAGKPLIRTKRRIGGNSSDKNYPRMSAIEVVNDGSLLIFSLGW